MKIIETEEIPKFKPVTVVFESQAEIDYIVTLLGASTQYIADFADINLNTYTLFDTFKSLSSRNLYGNLSKITFSIGK